MFLQILDQTDRNTGWEFLKSIQKVIEQVGFI